MTGNDGTREVHPLLRGEISYIGDWAEWKELWESTDQAELLHSLLHFGFAISCGESGDAIDRICLYLNIADGHLASWNFRKAERTQFSERTRLHTGLGVVDPEDLRRILAEKAFNILCQNFFKNTRGTDYPPSWVDAINDPLVLEKLFWFFRLDKDGRSFNIQGPDGDHHDEIAREFAYSLCTYLWFCEDIKDGRYYDGVYKWAKRTPPGTRLNLITLLFGLKRLDVLLDDHYKIDDSCLQRLEELALSYELWLPSTTLWSDYKRKPATLQEACLGKSQAAEVLLILRARQEAKKRLDEIRSLNVQREELERKLQQV